MAAQSKNAGRGRTVASQSSLLSSLLHLDSLTHLQPSLALLKSFPSSNVLSLERKEDLLCPFHLCNRLHALSINQRLRGKSVLQVFDTRILSANALLEFIDADHELLIFNLQSSVLLLEVGNVCGEDFVAGLLDGYVSVVLWTSLADKGSINSLAASWVLALGSVSWIYDRCFSDAGCML